MAESRIVVKESKRGNMADPSITPVEGIKMVSPNGTVWYISVSDTGNMDIVEVV